MTDLLTRRIALACAPEHAFAVFTEQIDLWWPRGHRRTREARLSFAEGALIEHAADGSQWVMARVTALEPPRLLAFDWYPGSPMAPTHVEVRFAVVAEGTEITVTHRALSPESAAIWPQRVGLFEKGWDAVLPALATFIAP